MVIVQPEQLPQTAVVNEAVLPYHSGMPPKPKTPPSLETIRNGQGRRQSMPTNRGFAWPAGCSGATSRPTSSRHVYGIA